MDCMSLLANKEEKVGFFSQPIKIVFNGIVGKTFRYAYANQINSSESN